MWWEVYGRLPYYTNTKPWVLGHVKASNKKEALEKAKRRYPEYTSITIKQSLREPISGYWEK